VGFLLRWHRPGAIGSAIRDCFLVASATLFDNFDCPLNCLRFAVASGASYRRHADRPPEQFLIAKIRNNSFLLNSF
jgi:hypothetical protein